MHALFGPARILVHVLVLAMRFVKNRFLKPILNRSLSTEPTVRETIDYEEAELIEIGGSPHHRCTIM